jgi:hypothetical protein
MMDTFFRIYTGQPKGKGSEKDSKEWSI